jgi:sugar lactone lactonase YvrE
MATTSFTASRRIAGLASTLLFSSLCLSGVAAGQSSAPLVIATSAAGLSHPTGWGTIQQSAIDSNGDWVVDDYANGAVYEFPAGGGAAITLVPVSGLGGGYENPAVVIDPSNNLYLGANWNNGIVMFPWNPAATAPGTDQWSGLSGVTASVATTAICTNSGKGNGTNCFAQYGIGGYSQGYFQPWGMAIGANGTMLVGNQNSNNFIFSLGINNAWTSPTSSGNVTVEQVSTMTKRPISVAQDPEGNVYFVEDSGGLPGLYRVPAGSSELASDTDPSITRVDPNLPSVSAVITDAAGNLYVSDSTEGVFFIPNPSGTPETASTIMLSLVTGGGEVAVDWTRSALYVPTSQTQVNNQADVAKVQFGYAELGSVAVAPNSTSQGWASFAFNGSVTPASFQVVEAGVATPDFSATAGTCTLGTAYAANSGCTATINFTPHSVGSISAKLLMLDAKNNVLATLPLHGTGAGSAVQVSPAVESALGSGLKTPTQVTLDEAGNIYVADPGLGEVVMFAVTAGKAGAPVSFGTGLTAPTGVAVDGAGDVFIADSGTGSVDEIPYGLTGLNTAGQVTLVSGLGSNLSLAVDGLGNLYIADPTDKQVVKISNIGASTVIGPQTETLLTAGFTAPSSIAVDENNNLYVIDGANLFWLAGGAGAPKTLLSNLSGSTGLAVDPSGALYITAAGGTTRIPLISGSLVTASEAQIAISVTSPTGVALDRSGNIYVLDGTALNVHLVTIGGTVSLSSPSSLTSSTTATATVTNFGNSPLSVTGYTSTNSVDFNAADGTCVGNSPLAPGASCQAVITFDPGAGQQGTLTSQIGVTSNAANGPTVIGATSVGLPLGNSATTLTIASTAQAVNTPVSVTVASSSGTGPVPTGQVTVTYTSWTVKTVTCTTPCPQQIVPETVTVTAALNGTGGAQFVLAPIMAGANTITVSYSGDRVYGTSSKSVTANIAKSPIVTLASPTFPDPSDVNLPFVVPNNGTGSVPYDSSETPWQYNFNMTVKTAFGTPTGTITMMDNSSTCPPGTSATGVGTATCALAGYSGVACPQNSAEGNLILETGSVPNAAGASFATTCLYQVPSGTTYTPVIYTHYITPVYSGDANFQGSNGSSTLLQATVGPLVQITTPDPGSATEPPTLSVTAGSTASVNLTLTSILGYGIAGKNGLLNNSTFPVTLSCDNLPPHATCSFYYPNPDPSISTAVDIPWPANCTTQEVAEGLTDSSGDVCAPSTVPVTTSSGVMTTGTGAAVMTINTDVTVGTTTSRNVTATSVTLAGIFGFGMLGLFVRRKAFEKGRLLLMVVLMVIAPALAVSITACSTTNLLPQTELASPAGSYAVTVTAQQVGDQCEPSGPLGSNCTTTSGGPGQLAHGTNNPVSLPFTVNVMVQQ